MKTHQYPVDLTDEQIEEFGNELEAIRNEVFDSRGDRDRAGEGAGARGARRSEQREREWRRRGRRFRV